MSRAIWWLLVIFAIGLIAGIIYYAIPKAHREPELQLPPAAVTPSAPSAPSTPAEPSAPSASAAPAAAEPQGHYLVPRDMGGKPLPALDASDQAIKQALDGFSSEKSIVDLLNIKGFIRRIVATIDSLPRKRVASRLMPVKRATGQFETSGSGQDVVIATGNARRYAAYVRFASAIDAGKLVAVYVHFYPLFQQAYQDLGYPNGYFNDRLIEVIDDLLAAPELKTPVRLVRPKVFYQFADPELEERSAGQKILMRIGAENEERIKAKLREIRAELTRTPSPKQ